MKNKFAFLNYVCYYILHVVICDVNMDRYPRRPKEKVTFHGHKIDRLARPRFIAGYI